MAIRSLLQEGVSPSLTEIQIFQINAQEDQEDHKAPILQARKIIFIQGDKVKVVKGDVKGLTGAIVSTSNDHATIMPYDENLCDQKLEFLVDDLSKFFETGDHVKVIAGRYNGITGMVAASKETTVDMICDVQKDVITVLSNDLKITEEVSSGAGQIENIHKDDIVTLNNEKTFGLVTKVDRDCIKALMENGETKNIWSHEIARRFSANKATAIDRDGNTLAYRDMVKITFSRHEKKDKCGSIKNAIRGTLFLYMPDSQDPNHSIIPVQSKYCVLLGSEDNKPQGQEISRKQQIGKTVRLTNGPYRGFSGRIMDILDQKARVELTSKNKIVMVDFDICAEIGTAADGLGLQNIEEGGKTPSRSPGYPVGTPAHDVASPWETPRHDPFRVDWGSTSPGTSRRF